MHAVFTFVCVFLRCTLCLRCTTLRSSSLSCGYSRCQCGKQYCKGDIIIFGTCNQQEEDIHEIRWWRWKFRYSHFWMYKGYMQIHDSLVQAPRHLPVSMLIPEKCNASHKLPTTPVLFPPIQITTAKTEKPGTNFLGANQKVSHQILFSKLYAAIYLCG